MMVDDDDVVVWLILVPNPDTCTHNNFEFSCELAASPP